MAATSSSGCIFSLTSASIPLSRSMERPASASFSVTSTFFVITETTFEHRVAGFGSRLPMKSASARQEATCP